MIRQKLSESALHQMLIDETRMRLGVDTNHIVEGVKITHRRGEPNWDAEIEMAGLATVKAFRAALQNIQRVYDYDLVWR